MAEYIEREVTCADCIHYDICIFHPTGNENEKCVHFKNKADFVEVRHGKWISELVERCDWRGKKQKYYQPISCNLCHNAVLERTNYCPNCGAKMDGKGEGE